VKNGAAATALPVRQIEEQLLSAVERGNRLVLTAPTGSGKTTQVPQMLLGAVRGEILVLQPRRLAARLVAQRVAAELGVPLGGLVGYQTRHDSKVSADTRVRFLTEGLFLRRLQSDPLLKGVGAVVLDEFHERSLAADLSLGLVRRLQEGARPDLRLLLMSATLDAESLAHWLECPALTTQGRTYPVAIRYRPSAAAVPPWQMATHALKELLDEEGEGDVLVFMPGAYEIRRTIQTMQDQLGRRIPLVFYPLYSSLPVRQQDAALAHSATRKVIVATNVAETSITIEGIRHVIDSGLARVHRHDPRRGIDALLIENISSAAAEQRAGRAGRTAPGTCTRLWSQEEQHARPARDAPEIQRLDLADALLQLHALSAGNIDAFPWLDAPDIDAVDRASLLLRDLGAIDSNNVLTPTGQQMAQLPCHPRLGRFLVAAAARACLERACIWAALIGERDLLEQPLRKEYSQSAAAWPSDLKVREGALVWAEDARFNAAACTGQGINAHAARQIGLTAKLYRDAARRSELKSNAKAKRGDQDEALGKCLLYAFYDRVAVRRGGGENLLCAMAGQRRVELDRNSCARQAQAFVALEVRELEARGDSQVRTALSLASAIDTAWLEEVHPERVSLEEETRWNAETRAVEALEKHLYGDLVYYQVPAAEVDAARAEEILVEQIASGHIRLEKWDRDVEQWIWRTRLLQRLFPQRQLVAYDDDETRVIYHEIVAGATRYSHIRNRPCLGHVQNALPWKEQQFVEQMAPTHWRLPAGPRMKIEYYSEGPPRGRAKIQELYGLEETPSIAGGKQQLLLEILGPNYRPVQVTDDLQSFWQRTYPEIKKDLKRRYPKHEWR
jgi:ATP-dependent helicase HrpB